ncbi:UNVERIFIED_CONTAM: hypothetical protein GTU68_066423 [Idotea baltica]|nr:hypothetical protein [Idotea baltica]
MMLTSLLCYWTIRNSKKHSLLM